MMMKTLLIKQDYKKAATKLIGQFPDLSHVTDMLDTATKVVTPDGRTSAVFLPGKISLKLLRRAHRLLKPVDGLVTNRAVAVGTRSLPRSMNKQGVPSPRSGVNARVLEVLEARQGILGYLDRPLRKSTLTLKHPEMLKGNRRLVRVVDELYKRTLPIQYATQSAELRKVSPEPRIANSVFSSVYVTKNFRTAYHIDANNLRGVMTALIPIGKFTGGELVLPRWRIAFAFKPGDLLLFDPQQVHGNLPFRGERLSAAFYCAGRIAEHDK
jgi:hypothetical protein